MLNFYGDYNNYEALPHGFAVSDILSDMVIFNSSCSTLGTKKEKKPS